MIAQLTGRVEALEEGRCVIDVNGVGYLVHASTRTLAALPGAPEQARLLVETHVREDAICSTASPMRLNATGSAC